MAHPILNTRGDNNNLVALRFVLGYLRLRVCIDERLSFLLRKSAAQVVELLQWYVLEIVRKDFLFCFLIIIQTQFHQNQ